MRLARPVFAEFVVENAAIRDAAATLSHLRDGEVLHDTLAALQKWRPDPLLVSLADRPLALAAHDGDAALADFRNRLLAIRERAERWTLKSSDPRRLLDGLRRTYASGRRRMKDARRSRGPMAFHDWRKANKYYGFHLDLLKKAAPETIAGALEVVDQLSVVLGEHHDLAVLRAVARAMPSRSMQASAKR